MADEGEMRRILRAGWRGPGELAWVEHARGGTEGNPDVFVPLGKGHGYLPLELKWWEIEGGIVTFFARPAQRRFHRLAYESFQRTAFLALLSDGKIVLLPGGSMPRPGLETMKLDFFWVLDDVRWLGNFLRDPNFWRGKAR